MAATAIGLDVGTNAVRAVEIELGDSPLIRRMGQVGLPVGAVVDGEVADVGAVSIALRELWTQAGFRSRRTRVGMSSARVIVRTIEMPRLSHDELMSTIRLQLDDYVPLPPDDTVFDIRPMDGSQPAQPTQQLLLAATHQDAVQPLLMAMHGADLKVVAVDVIPAALALALTHPEPDQDASVDVILSIGAGTVVVIAARGGEPLFARTLTNACGRRTTERIAARLGIGQLEAERYKRLGATEDATSAVAIQASTESLDELIEEVRASLAFYGEQPSSQHVRRVLVTGGGAQLPGLPEALVDALGIDVERADPFVGVRLGRTGFEPGDLPYLAPYMAAALGVALGQSRPKDRRLDLTPMAKRASHMLDARRLLAGVGVVVVVGAAGALYLHGRNQIASERDQAATAVAQLTDLQTQISARAPVTGVKTSTGDIATPAAVAASVAQSDIDWVAVQQAVEAGSAPLGVIVDSFQGVVGASGVTTTSAGAARPGKLTLTATAPGLLAVADWLDAVAADPRFAEPWAAGFTMVARPDGSTAVQFTMEMFVTAENLVDRSTTAEVPA
jgi:type IV pilus assembly protein PilM